MHYTTNAKMQYNHSIDIMIFNCFQENSTNDMPYPRCLSTHTHSKAHRIIHITIKTKQIERRFCHFSQYAIAKWIIL